MGQHHPLLEELKNTMIRAVMCQEDTELNHHHGSDVP
jgi:membrane carboxypeptidase/penicillin-binding protein